MNKKVVLRESKKIVITLGMVASLVACTKEKPQEVNNDNKAESTVSTENVSQTPILKMDGSVEFKYGAPVGADRNGDYISVQLGPNAYKTLDDYDESVADQDKMYLISKSDKNQGKYELSSKEHDKESEILAEYDSECSNMGYSENNTIYFTCGKKAYQYDIDKKESNIIDSLGNYDIDKMYVVNDDVLVFSTGHEIYEYSVKEDSIFKYDNKVEFTDFVPTSYGMVTWIQNTDNCNLYLNNNQIFKDVKMDSVYPYNECIDFYATGEEFYNEVMEYSEYDKSLYTSCQNEEFNNQYRINYCDLEKDDTFEKIYYIPPCS